MPAAMKTSTMPAVASVMKVAVRVQRIVMVRRSRQHAVGAIERCKARGTNLGVLFIDLDNFKNVNDTLGHDVGDLLLQAVAVRLQSCVRADDIIWRLGGDEFIVTMEHVRNRAEAEVVCRRIADALGPPFVIREVSISTSASIGVAFCPEEPPPSARVPGQNGMARALLLRFQTSRCLAGLPP